MPGRCTGLITVKDIEKVGFEPAFLERFAQGRLLAAAAVGTGDTGTERTEDHG